MINFSRASPILDAGAWLHGLELGRDAPDAPIRHPVEVHQRRVPNQLQHITKKIQSSSFSLSNHIPIPIQKNATTMKNKKPFWRSLTSVTSLAMVSPIIPSGIWNKPNKKQKSRTHTHTQKNHPQNHHINPEKLQSNPIRDNREGGHCLPIWQRNNNNPCSSLGNGGSWSWRRKHQDARFYTGEEEGEVHDCAERRGPRCTVSLQMGPAGDRPDGRCTWTGGGAFVEPGRPWFARRQQREREAIEFSELWRNCPSHSSLSPSLSLPINKCLQLRKFNRGKTIWDYPIDLFMVCRIWRLRKFVCCRLWDIDIRVELFRLVLPMSKKKPTSINESGHTWT